MIQGYLCIYVLLYYAELCAFIAGEAYVVLLFEFFNCFLVCVANARLPSLGLQFFKCKLEFVVDPPELALKFVFGFGSVDVSGLWIVFLLFFKIDNEKLFPGKPQDNRKHSAYGLQIQLKSWVDVVAAIFVTKFHFLIGLLCTLFIIRQFQLGISYQQWGFYTARCI